jgi:hypothetical protein
MNPQVKMFFSVITFFSALIGTSYYGQSALSVNQQQKGNDENTCAGLQAMANKAYKKFNTSFQGFEGIPMQTNVYNFKAEGTDRLCQLGYMTKITPMGKRICRAHIYTNIKEENMRVGIGPIRTTFYDPENSESEYCRYVD